MTSTPTPQNSVGRDVLRRRWRIAHHYCLPLPSFLFSLRFSIFHFSCESERFWVLTGSDRFDSWELGGVQAVSGRAPGRSRDFTNKSRRHPKLDAPPIFSTKRLERYLGRNRYCTVRLDCSAVGRHFYIRTHHRQTAYRCKALINASILGLCWLRETSWLVSYEADKVWGLDYLYLKVMHLQI